MKREALNRLIKQTVRNLRKEQTESEAVLWQELRNRKLLGKKFLRQHPIIFKWNKRTRFLIADFYCHEAKLVVELDGEIHDKQKDYDKVRDFVLKSLGIKVVRINNIEVKKRLPGVVKRLEKEL